MRILSKYIKMGCSCKGCEKAEKLLIEDVAVKFAEIAIEGKSKLPLAGTMFKIDRMVNGKAKKSI